MIPSESGCGCNTYVIGVLQHFDAMGGELHDEPLFYAALQPLQHFRRPRLCRCLILFLIFRPLPQVQCDALGYTSQHKGAYKSEAQE
jgi:hypothetical protein